MRVCPDVYVEANSGQAAKPSAHVQRQRRVAGASHTSRAPQCHVAWYSLWSVPLEQLNHSLSDLQCMPRCSADTD